jgi:hypothetical protein
MAHAEQSRSGLERLREAVTPHPHRGDLVAAGAAPLTLGVLLVNVRLDGEWGTGVFLALTALACALVLAMGVLAPLEGTRPRSYQQVLLVAGLVLLLVALLRVAQVLGVEDPLSAAGARMWIFALLTLVSAWLVEARHAAVFMLVAAVTGLVTVLALVEWAFEPEGLTTTRWILLTLALGFVLAALGHRDARRRESVYLIDAAGIAILVLALTFVGSLISALTFLGAPGATPGGGWKLILVAAGFGLVAYAAVDRESGPAYIGALILILFTAFAGIPAADGASLWFWPLSLLLVGGFAVVAGLRPRRPLPPEPPGAGAPAEPVPGPGSTGGLWAEREPG